MVQFFFISHRISWQWVDGNLYYVFFQQMTRMELPYNPVKSSLIFLVLFLFLRTCLYFFPCLRINLNLPYFFKKVMYISKALYIVEKSSKHLIRQRPVSWPFVLLCFWSLSYFRLGLFFVWLYDPVFKEKELNFSLPITKKLWLVFIRF